jgi:hypothetical protein
MSDDLYAQGKPRDEPPVEYMSNDLKVILTHHVWGGCGGTWEERWLDRTDVQYLSGLADAGIDGAEELIEMIQEYGSVKVWIS